MLSIDDLHFAYGAGLVLEGLSLEVRRGSIHGILGTNGAGKTTLFKCLYGLLRPDRGVITWAGASLQYQQIAFLETRNFFYSYMTGREYLQLCRVVASDFSIERWNQIFELPLDQLVDTYSTGMKKQLAFLGTLAQQRPILILDEPFNGLDLESSEKLALILERLRATGKTMLIASHILETLTHNCDRISRLSDGRIRQTYESADFPAMTADLRDQLRRDMTDKLDEVL